MKYLKMKEQWVIRGTKEIPRLYNWNNNKTIKLNNQVLQYLIQCNGSLTIKDICNKYNETEEVAEKFFKKFVDEGAIELIEAPNLSDIDISLGEKEPWLKEIHFDVTDHCNLKCKHCFWGENITCNENLPIGNWKKLICDVKKLGVGKIVISGGEAFTRKDLFEIVTSCYEQKLFVGAIFTNGTIEGQNVNDVVNFITQKEMGTTFYISMDGFKKEQHDFIRGDGNFDKTLAFVNRLVKNRSTNNANYNIFINSIIHKKNYLELIEWYDFLENLGVDSWRFTTGRISGSLEKNLEDVKILSTECFPQYVEVTKYGIEKYKKHEGLHLNVENFFNTRYLERGNIVFFSKESPICNYKSQAISVDPYGNVQFCTGWQDRKYGNVFNTNISDIWYSKDLQQMKNFKIKEVSECQDCKYIKYCGGGCRLEADDIYSKDEYVCENFKMFDELMMPILNALDIDFIED